MKKFTIAFLFSLLCIGTISAQSADTTKSRVTDTSKLTYTKVYNDAKSFLGGLAKALQVGSEHVYEVLVKQQVVKAVTDLGIVVALLIATSYFIRRFNKERSWLVLKDHRWYGDVLGDHEATIAYLIIGILLSVATIGTIAGLFPDIVSGFVNPEYGAMKDIMNFISK